MVIMTSEDGHHKCDEKCYDAKRIKCTCICGGKNHGVGLRQALKNLQELVDGMNMGAQHENPHD